MAAQMGGCAFRPLGLLLSFALLRGRFPFLTLEFAMQEFDLAALFMLGFLAGGHCLGMCGGIVAALSLQQRQATRHWPLMLAYNGGRLASYSLVGALVGGIGGLGIAALNIEALQYLLYALANLLLIAMGLYLMGVSAFITQLERLGKPLWRYLQPAMQRLLPVRTLRQAVLVGALWGWLPCGMVYTASLSALASGSVSKGALTMLAFGLGTLPNLLVMGAFADALRTLARQPLVRWTSGGLICALGLWRLVQVL